MTDPILHLKLSAEQAEQFRPLLERWRIEDQAALFLCAGESFDPETGELVLKIHATVSPRSIARKAALVLKKGAI